MDVRMVDETFSVSPQLRPEDMPSLSAAGYATVICNRPDGEQEGQPSADMMRQAASDAGLAFHYLPIAGRDFSGEAVAEFRSLRRAAVGPVVAYCRSGMRSIMLETLANPNGRSVEDRLQRASAAGYDLSAVRGRLHD